MSSQRAKQLTHGIQTAQVTEVRWPYDICNHGNNEASVLCIVSLMNGNMKLLVAYMC